MEAPSPDVERFFRHLARTLAETDPARLRRPIPLAEVHQTIVPYRSHRRALGIASSDEYEGVLLRLCAGEGGLVRVEPEEVRARFAREADTAHPDLDLLHQHGEVTLTLARDAVVRALEPALSSSAPAEPFTEPLAESLPGSAEPAFQPVAEARPVPAPDTSPPSTRDDLAQLAEPSAEAQPPSCASCGGLLPVGRTVHFCPHCGQSLAQPRCRQCGAELERAWRHCVECGAPVRST